MTNGGEKIKAWLMWPSVGQLGEMISAPALPKEWADAARLASQLDFSL